MPDTIPNAEDAGYPNSRYLPIVPPNPNAAMNEAMIRELKIDGPPSLSAGVGDVVAAVHLPDMEVVAAAEEQHHEEEEQSESPDGGEDQHGGVSSESARMIALIIPSAAAESRESGGSRVVRALRITPVAAPRQILSGRRHGSRDEVARNVCQ